MIAFKLLKVRRDGSIGPLFINASARLPIGEWMQAEDHPTKGFAHRPGWHCTLRPEAPHLAMRLKPGQRREWFVVQLDGVEFHTRPQAQGGRWALAQQMKILGPINSPIAQLEKGGDHHGSH